MSDIHATKKPARTSRRNPRLTRQILLEAAFEEIHSQGFRAASLDRILSTTGLTKGALYHHFPNKQALGYAVLDEVIIPGLVREWSALLDASRNPIDALREILEHEIAGKAEERVRKGCPVNNLVQEMSSIDEGFRQRLVAFQDRWIGAMAKALRRGQMAGQVRPEFDALQLATLLVAGFEGSSGIAKCHQEPRMFTRCMESMIGFLETLRL